MASQKCYGHLDASGRYLDPEANCDRFHTVGNIYHTEDRLMPNTERILVVEDNRDAQEGLYSLLFGEGYSVLTADDGQQALDLIERGIRPRLVILDLVLPKVTGSDLVRYMQSDPELRTTRIIVITGMSPQDVHVIADMILYKPIDVPVLLDAVAGLMPPSARSKARR
jgi:CheY-like chemotaxis protein